MTEELNNQDLFNLEDNDSFIGGDDFPDLPPLTFELEEESIDIANIPAEEPTEAAEETNAAGGKDEKKTKKERKPLFAFLKKGDGEKTPKAPKEKQAKTDKLAKTAKAKTPRVKKEKTVREPKEKQERPERVKKDIDWRALGPMFWTISGAIALLIAVILLIIVAVIGFNAVKVANAVNQDLVGSLHESFVQMDQAHIQTTIPINAEVPAKFDLQLDTITSVTLSEDVFIDNANVSLSTGGLTISNAPTDITLPAGSELPIHLVLTVPVDEMIPVVMNVDVDIPMAETELHEPFVNLQQTIAPYYMWLWSLTTKGVSPLDYPWEQ